MMNLCRLKAIVQIRDNCHCLRGITHVNNFERNVNTELTDIVKTVKKGTDGETIAHLREKTAKALMTYSNETSQFVGVADDLELALRNDWLIISDTRSTFNSLNVSE